MKRKPNAQCRICQKHIYRRPIHVDTGNVYCSLKCSGLGQRKKKICRICSKQYAGSKKTCSRTCANKARTGIVYTKERKFDKAYRGRILKEEIANQRGGVCEWCSEHNYAILQIHHIRERYQGGTDDLRNLQLLCPNCHATHHLGRSLFTPRNGDKVRRTK